MAKVAKETMRYVVAPLEYNAISLGNLHDNTS